MGVGAGRGDDRHTPRFDDSVDVGDTRKELITFINSVVKTFGSAPYGPAMQALVSEIATQPELARIYRERVVEPRGATLAPVIARGDLRPDTDLRLLHEFLVGPTFYRIFLSGGTLDRKLGTHLVDAILEGFALSDGAGPARRTRSR